MKWEVIKYVSEKVRQRFPNYELTEGDILISLDRPLISTGLKVAKVSSIDLPCLLLQRVGRVHFLDKSLLPEFFFFWLNSPDFISKINPGRSNGVPHISPKEIEGISFSPPSIDEQNKKIQLLRDIQSKINFLLQIENTKKKTLNVLPSLLLNRIIKNKLIKG